MLRWPLIRHIRWFWGQWCVRRYAAKWASVGIGLGHPNQSDLDVLDAIWRGER